VRRDWDYVFGADGFFCLSPEIAEDFVIASVYGAGTPNFGMKNPWFVVLAQGLQSRVPRLDVIAKMK
jgi:hypothetical protein